MTHELAVLSFFATVVGAFVLVALLGVRRRREVQRALTAGAPPGAWTTPIVLALEERPAEPAAPAEPPAPAEPAAPAAPAAPAEPAAPAAPEPAKPKPAAKTFSGFEAAGVLIVDGASVALRFRRLRGLGSWTRDGAPFEQVALDASAKVVGLEPLAGVTGLRLEHAGGRVWLAVDHAGAFVTSDQHARELAPRLERALGGAPAPRGGDAPLLRLGSVGRAEAWNVARALQPGLIVAAALVLFAAREWLAQIGGGPFGVVPPRALVLLLLVAGGLAVHHLLRKAGGQACAVVLFEDRLVFTRERTATVRWDEVTGYRDDSEGFVRLAARAGAGGGMDLTIPTRTEEERTAVLALLDARGLPRLEG